MFPTSQNDKKRGLGAGPAAPHGRPGLGQAAPPNPGSGDASALAAAPQPANPFGTSNSADQKEAAGFVKSPHHLPSVSLPSGGGSLRGMGEKFSVNPAAGTGSFSVPVATSPGRGGVGAQLALSYDSGGGSGPFGMGWALSTSSIRRKTDKGIPRYREGRDDDDEDVFQITGAEDLVPALQCDGTVFGGRKVHTRQREDGCILKVTAYRPRIEGAFLRIWKVEDAGSGETHWEVKAPNNATTIYGDSAACRIADPEDPLRVFEWLPSRAYDEKGNLTVFEYKAEDSDNVDVGAVHEQHRTAQSRSAHRYLKSIRYGNTVSRVSPDFAVSGTDWLFQVIFDYGEHDDNNPTTTECRPWMCRPDPFSSFRAGFEIRQYRLCRRLLMFHHFPDEPSIGRDCVVSAFHLSYRAVGQDLATGLAVTTVVESVHQEAWRRRDGGGHGYDRASLPPVEFTYSTARASEVPHVLDSDSLANLPVGVDDAAYQFVDLEGQGLTGVVARTNGALMYIPNIGDAEFGAAETLLRVPGAVFSADAGSWMDLDGDGKTELVKLNGQAPGFYSRDWDEGSGWGCFQAFQSLPGIPWNDRNVRIIDLTGDGLADVMVTDGEHIRIYYGQGKSGFTDGHMVPAPPQTEGGSARLLFWDGAEVLYTADMSGDGLADIVKIRHSEVCYWPNLGYGRFGRKVTMRNPPAFDHPELFNQSLLKLADVDGSGTTDLVYLGGRTPMVYQNLAGNGWSESIPLHGFPSVNQASNVQVVDLLGKGTPCLVWSSKLPSDAGRQICYLELMEEKPYLLVKVDGNTGAETSLTYTSSSRFYARDKKAGRPWVSHLPFPVHCVEKVETVDRISGTVFTTRYSYHDGYFDGVEREFRGFGMVESWDTEHYSNLEARQRKHANIDEASHIPPMLTRAWFHTGQYERDHGSAGHQHRQQYYRNLDLHPNLADMGLSETVLPSSIRVPAGNVRHELGFQEQQEAYRALKGSPLRSEVYSLDGTALERIPVSVTEASYTLEQRQPLGRNRHAVFMTHPKESLDMLYDRKLFHVEAKKRLDPRIQQTLSLETDFFGNPVRELAINYGRRYDDLNPMLTEADRAKQRRAYAMLTETSYTNMIDTDAAYVLPAVAESRTYELINVMSVADGSVNNDRRCWVSFENARRAGAALSSGDFDVPFENFDGPYPSTTQPYRRMIKKSRSIFRRDDLSGPLPLGVVEPLMLPHKNHDLAFTDAQAQQYVSAGKLKASEIVHLFGTEGAYHRFPGEDGWWSNSGDAFFSPDDACPAEELRVARENFFVIRRSRTPWHTDAESTETRYSYDRYNLLLQDVVDPYGNIASAGERARDPSAPLLRRGHDYRLLTAFLRMDANRNCVEVLFDIFGHVAASVTRGKPEAKDGDSLQGVKADLDDAEVQAYYSAPKTHSVGLLGKTTSRSVYDLHAYRRTKHREHPQPNWSSSITRETHESNLAKGAESRVFVSFSYVDGTGRPVQVKAQCEAAPLVERDALETTSSGRDGDETVQHRWLASAWVIYNNKGSPVRSYEPFFSATHCFEDKAIHGVSPVYVYDALGRTVATVHPDRTWSKVAFSPWDARTWDRTDTVLITNPATDPDVGGFIARLGEDEYLPTWYSQRTCSAGPFGPEEARAAEASAVHAGTPSVAFFDALGRSCAKFETIRSGKDAGHVKEDVIRQASFTDILGLPYKVVDTMGRTASRMTYSFGKAVIREEHMDSGEKWVLKDAGGAPIRTWNGRGEVFRPVFDRNRRARALYIGAGEAEYLVEKTVYGEDWPAGEEANARGRIVEVFDQSGVSKTPAYDFKGNVLRATRQLVRQSHGIVEWRSEVVELETASYDEVVYFNALNKVTRTLLPDGTETWYTYNDRMMLQNVSTILAKSHDKQVVIKEIAYDSKGQRTRVLQGNGVETLVSYDKLNFKVRRIVARRHRARNPDRSDSETSSSSGSGSDNGRSPSWRRKPRRGAREVGKLQDLQYTYDASGNIMHIKDDAKQTVFFRNCRVDPSQSFRYDSLYRLVEAAGREHVGQMAIAKDGRDRPGHTAVGEASGDHANDGKALARYTERYDYDSQGNIVALHHQTPSESKAWTRFYEYSEASAIVGEEKNNRLSRTRVGRRVEEYRYDGPAGITGSMTCMATVPSLEYDYADHMVTSRSSSQPEGSEAAGQETTRYRYDATGKRVRKITERKLADGAVVPIKETLYIGGAFEVFRRYSGSGEITLEIHSLTVAESGRRLLLIDNQTAGPTSRAPSTLYRYQLSNHQGSAALEVDQNAMILSYEEYTPYGVSSLRAAFRQTEAPKRYRFLGKEQDDSGLYHLGARYYAAWLGRFTSADPKGTEDGLNLYQYAHSNPVMLADPGGTQAGPVTAALGWTKKLLDARGGLPAKIAHAADTMSGRQLVNNLSNFFAPRAAQDFARMLQNNMAEAGQTAVAGFEKSFKAVEGAAKATRADVLFENLRHVWEHKLSTATRYFREDGSFAWGGKWKLNRFIKDLGTQVQTAAKNVAGATGELAGMRPPKLGITVRGLAEGTPGYQAFVDAIHKAEGLKGTIVEIVHEMDPALVKARDELNAAAKIVGAESKQLLLTGKRVADDAAQAAKAVKGKGVVGVALAAVGVGVAVLLASGSASAQETSAQGGVPEPEAPPPTAGERVQGALDNADLAMGAGEMAVGFAAKRGLVTAAAAAGVGTAALVVSSAAAGASVGSAVADAVEKPLQSVLGEAAGAGAAAGTGVLAGAATGAVMGAVVGSVIPGVGTAVGAAIGGVAGAVGAGAKILIDRFW